MIQILRDFCGFIVSATVVALCVAMVAVNAAFDRHWLAVVAWVAPAIINALAAQYAFDNAKWRRLVRLLAARGGAS